MPTFRYLKEAQIIERSIPRPTDEVIPGVLWGSPEVLFTPAFWLAQYWMREGYLAPRTHSLGRTLEEEVVACLLGGHGIPAEVAFAAFDRLRTSGLISQRLTHSDVISQKLREPLTVSGRRVTYRFWSQKARYIADALRTLKEQPAPQDSAHELRAYLLRIPGIGFKIASWIVRNWLSSDDVAILDIHIVRAGNLMSLYSAEDQVSRDYLDMERRFLDLARAMNAHASDLDALIWFEMRRSPRLVTRLLREIQVVSESF
jgi:N-glycosylase/DNA lyase